MCLHRITIKRRKQSYSNLLKDCIKKGIFICPNLIISIYIFKTKQNKKQYLCAKGNKLLILCKRQQVLFSAIAKTNIFKKKYVETVLYISNAWLTDVYIGHTFTTVSDVNIASQFLMSDQARSVSSMQAPGFGQHGQPCMFLLGRTPVPYLTEQGTYVAVTH